MWEFQWACFQPNSMVTFELGFMCQENKRNHSKTGKQSQIFTGIPLKKNYQILDIQEMGRS